MATNHTQYTSDFHIGVIKALRDLEHSTTPLVEVTNTLATISAMVVASGVLRHPKNVLRAVHAMVKDSGAQNSAHWRVADSLHAMQPNHIFFHLKGDLIEYHSWRVHQNTGIWLGLEAEALDLNGRFYHGNNHYKVNVTLWNAHNDALHAQPQPALVVQGFVFPNPPHI
jgi:hypothetical protein